MNVYYSDSFRRPGKNHPLKPIALLKTITWEDLDIFLPAVYAGEEGVVLDLCVRIPIERIEAFLKKWTQEKRLSELTDEEAELMEQENPTYLDFQADVQWNNEALIQKNMISTGWHPLELEQENISREARELMEAYHCDPASAWQFVRCLYRWPDQPETSLTSLKLHFHERTASATSGYFSTDEGCEEQQIRLKHPVTQKDYILTLRQYQAAVLEHDIFPGREELMYPTHYRTLHYSIFPGLSSEQFRLQDCDKSDPPVKKTDIQTDSVKAADGPIAVFIAGKSEDPALLAAMSSLHFKPVSKVNWRAIFQIAKRPDMEMEFTLNG